MKSIRTLLSCIFLGILINGVTLQAQDAKPKHRFFIGAGIGACDVAFKQLGKTVSGIGPSINAFLGYRFSEKWSLRLEYSINHPNDEQPRITDIVVTKTIYNGDVILGTKMVRNPAVLRTDFILISFQKNAASNFFYQINGGFGWNHAASYYIPKDEVIEACISKELGYALGLSGGYERPLSDHLSFFLEGSVRWSSGEDSTNARFVFGLGAGAKWDF